jgi:hypothetical protein
VAILGAIAVQQLRPTPPDKAGGASTPKIPTRPQDIETFERDINRFVEDAGRRRASEIDEATK